MMIKKGRMPDRKYKKLLFLKRVKKEGRKKKKRNCNNVCKKRRQIERTTCYDVQELWSLWCLLFAVFVVVFRGKTTSNSFFVEKRHLTLSLETNERQVKELRPL